MEFSRTTWFEEARFGLFIHWNACAALEGRYCGEPVRQSEYGEWLRARNRVPRADWDSAIRQLHVTPEMVESWAESALLAGMKYVIFVTKHHDGLAYWPSEHSDYTLNQIAGVEFDVIAKLKEACDARGLKLGFYYSHWHDWEHPFGWGNFWDYNTSNPDQFKDVPDLFIFDGEGFRDNLTQKQFRQYWEEKSMAQVRELIRRYQPASLWFDCWLPLDQTIMTEQDLADMLSMIREEDPKVVVNSRIGTSIIGPAGADYETLGDNEFPAAGIEHPWESAVTFALSWGFSRDDQRWRPATYFLRNLVRNIALGGNLVINFGPTANGAIPEEASHCMALLGRTITRNGAGYYGNTPSPFPVDSQDWGIITQLSPNELALHIFDWPVDGVIRLHGLVSEVDQVSLATNGADLAFQQSGRSLRIHAPRSMPVSLDTVIRVSTCAPAEADTKGIGEINGGGFSLSAATGELSGPSREVPITHSTKLPNQIGGWTTPTDQVTWTIVVSTAGPREIKLCYAATAEVAGQTVLVDAAGQQLAHSTQATQLNWTEFRPFTIGMIDFPAPGEYEIQVSPQNDVRGELFKLLWVYVGRGSEV